MRFWLDKVEYDLIFSKHRNAFNFFCGKFSRKFFSSFQAQTNNSDNTPAYNSFLHTVCDVNIKLCVFYVYIYPWELWEIVRRILNFLAVAKLEGQNGNSIQFSWVYIVYKGP